AMQALGRQALDVVEAGFGHGWVPAGGDAKNHRSNPARAGVARTPNPYRRYFIWTDPVTVVMTVPLPASTGKASSAPAIAFIIAIARGTGGCIDSVVTETSRTVNP